MRNTLDAARAKGTNAPERSFRLSSAIATLVLLLLACQLSSAAPATEPVPGDMSLANNTVRFQSPDGWQAIASAATDVAAAFAWPDHGSALSIEVLPTTATTDARAAEAIIERLQSMRRQRKEALIVGPALEKDDRFALRIHERYQSGDQPVDQWHLYRKVGPRVVMVTIRVATDNADDVKGAVVAGENTALSATFGRPKR